MSKRENIFLCDSCRKVKSHECNVMDQMKGLFRTYSQAYDVHGFFAITKCDRFEGFIEVEFTMPNSCPNGKCD